MQSQTFTCYANTGCKPPVLAPGVHESVPVIPHVTSPVIPHVATTLAFTGADIRLLAIVGVSTCLASIPLLKRYRKHAR